MKQFRSKLIPVVYYSVAETSSYYYILYAFYHADDLTHDNDLEGCLLIVKKDGDGELQGMLTVAHYEIPSYVYLDRLKAGGVGANSVGELLAEEDAEGKLRPRTKQTALKHALYAWKGTPLWEMLGVSPPRETAEKKTSAWKRIREAPRMFSNVWRLGLGEYAESLVLGRRDEMSATGIRYFPGTKPKRPKLDGNVSFQNTIGVYALVDMLGDQGLWNQRDNKETFPERDGFFNSKIKAACAPWRWDDWNVDVDRNLQTGALFFEPALVARNHFSGFDPEPQDDYEDYWQAVRRLKHAGERLA